jgi:hypothetical protein
MMLQLEPPVKLRHKDGRKFTALVLLDYGPDYEMLWIGGFEDSGEIWAVPNRELRLVENVSLGREDTAAEQDDADHKAP